MKKMTFLAAAAAALACLWGCEDPLDEVIAEVSVSPASVTFESEGGTLKVAVNANVAFNITGAASWLKVEKSEKELALTAEANTVNEARSCELTLTAGTASAKVTVNQKAGSPYPGFTVAKSADFEYMGTMLYQFLKPSEEDYGGVALLVLTDEDENGITLWIYTDLFASEEEVTLSPGTYVKGDDAYPSLCAKKLTYMKGMLTNPDDEDDPYYMGSYYDIIATGELGALTDGTIEIIANKDNTYIIKADMMDAKGKAFKYVYTGEVSINTEGAGYPGPTDRVDVANTVFAASCIYNGDVYANGTTNFSLMIYSGDPEDPAVTVYSFNASACEYSENINLTGMYTTADEEAEDPFAAGFIIPGTMSEMEGFSFPMGTYVMYSFGDYLIGDGYDSLSLERTDDGVYTLSGAIMSTSGEYVMFMNVENLDIEIIDGTDEEED